MRKFTTSLVASITLVAVASLGAPANADSEIDVRVNYRVGSGWCC